MDNNINNRKLSDDDRTKLVEMVLYKKALEGDIKAIMAWLTSRAPDRWKNVNVEANDELNWREQIDAMIREREAQK